MSEREPGVLQPILAGTVASIVGFFTAHEDDPAFRPQGT